MFLKNGKEIVFFNCIRGRLPSPLADISANNASFVVVDVLPYIDVLLQSCISREVLLTFKKEKII